MKMWKRKYYTQASWKKERTWQTVGEDNNGWIKIESESDLP